MPTARRLNSACDLGSWRCCYLLPSVAIVGACLAVYATSLHVPPAEDQLTFRAGCTRVSAPTCTCTAEAAGCTRIPFHANTCTARAGKACFPPCPKPPRYPIRQPHRSPLGGHRRPNLQHSNRGPPHPLSTSCFNRPRLRSLAIVLHSFAACRDSQPPSVTGCGSRCAGISPATHTAISPRTTAAHIGQHIRCIGRLGPDHRTMAFV